MADKPKNTTSKDGEKDAESKSDKFRRVAGDRTAKVLASIDSLAGTTRTATYEYTDEQADKIVAALRARVDKLDEQFKTKGGNKATFAL